MHVYIATHFEKLSGGAHQWVCRCVSLSVSLSNLSLSRTYERKGCKTLRRTKYWFIQYIMHGCPSCLQQNSCYSLQADRQAEARTTQVIKSTSKEVTSRPTNQLTRLTRQSLTRLPCVRTYVDIPLCPWRYRWSIILYTTKNSPYITSFMQLNGQNEKAGHLAVAQNKTREPFPFGPWDK